MKRGLRLQKSKKNRKFKKKKPESWAVSSAQTNSARMLPANPYWQQHFRFGSQNSCERHKLNSCATNLFHPTCVCVRMCVCVCACERVCVENFKVKRDYYIESKGQAPFPGRTWRKRSYSLVYGNWHVMRLRLTTTTTTRTATTTAAAWTGDWQQCCPHPDAILTCPCDRAVVWQIPRHSQSRRPLRLTPHVKVSLSLGAQCCKFLKIKQTIFKVNKFRVTKRIIA